MAKFHQHGVGLLRGVGPRPDFWQWNSLRVRSRAPRVVWGGVAHVLKPVSGSRRFICRLAGGAHLAPAGSSAGGTRPPAHFHGSTGMAVRLDGCDEPSPQPMSPRGRFPVFYSYVAQPCSYLSLYRVVSGRGRLEAMTHLLISPVAWVPPKKPRHAFCPCPPEFRFAPPPLFTLRIVGLWLSLPSGSPAALFCCGSYRCLSTRSKDFPARFPSRASFVVWTTPLRCLAPLPPPCLEPSAPVGATPPSGGPVHPFPFCPDPAAAPARGLTEPPT